MEPVIRNIQKTILQNQTNANTSSEQSSESTLTQGQQAALARVMQISFDQSLRRKQKPDGLSLAHRKMISNLKMKKSKQQCTICLEGFTEGEVIKKLPCKHILHRQCAKTWLKLKKHCPVCRLDLEEHFRKQEETTKEKEKNKCHSSINKELLCQQS